jgi:hypothetical protein
VREGIAELRREAPTTGGTARSVVGPCHRNPPTRTVMLPMRLGAGGGAAQEVVSPRSPQNNYDSSSFLLLVWRSPLRAGLCTPSTAFYASDAHERSANRDRRSGA